MVELLLLKAGENPCLSDPGSKSYLESRLESCSLSLSLSWVPHDLVRGLFLSIWNQIHKLGASWCIVVQVWLVVEKKERVRELNTLHDGNRWRSYQSFLIWHITIRLKHNQGGKVHRVYVIGWKISNRLISFDFSDFYHKRCLGANILNTKQQLQFRLLKICRRSRGQK